jgi:anti-sigma-K factor RskA
MTEHRRHDEALLMDFLTGSSPESAGEIQRRLEQEPEFRALHDDIARTLSALKLAPEVAPPADLAQRTLLRIERLRKTEALVAREELHRRTFFRPMFSLRELGAVAVAAVVLVAVFLPSVQKARQQTAADLCASQQAQIGAAINMFTGANNGSLPSVSASQVQGRWLPAEGQQSVSNSTGLFKLIIAGYAPSELFQCPAVGGQSPSGFALQAGMADFPAAKFVNYSYQHNLGANELSINNPALQAVAKDMAILADETPLFVGGRFRPDRINLPGSDSHGQRGQNVLYLDMHVQWAHSPAVGVGGDHIFLVNGINNYRGDEAPSGSTDSFLLPSYSGK